MRHAERGGATIAFQRLLTAVVIIALIGAVGYLAAQLHRREYRMRTEGRVLVLERGRLFPIGYELYVPEDKGLAQAYAPLPLPPFVELPVTQRFDDRNALDRALFTLLTAWAVDGLKRPNMAEAVAEYVRRAEALPGLTELQHQELRQFRGTVAIYSAQHLLDDGVALLRQAKEEIGIAGSTKASQSPEAKRLIGELERRLAACAEGAAAPEPDALPQAPNSSDEAPKSPNEAPNEAPKGPIGALGGIVEAPASTPAPSETRRLTTPAAEPTR